jgi:hypothetical protein
MDRADLRSAMAVARLGTVGDSYQTASALTMTHPNLATIDSDATAATTTEALLAETAEVGHPRHRHRPDAAGGARLRHLGTSGRPGRVAFSTRDPEASMSE